MIVVLDLTVVAENSLGYLPCLSWCTFSCKSSGHILRLEHVLHGGTKSAALRTGRLQCPGYVTALAWTRVHAYRAWGAIGSVVKLVALSYE